MIIKGKKITYDHYNGDCIYINEDYIYYLKNQDNGYVVQYGEIKKNGAIDDHYNATMNYQQLIYAIVREAKLYKEENDFEICDQKTGEIMITARTEAGVVYFGNAMREVIIKWDITNDALLKKEHYDKEGVAETIICAVKKYFPKRLGIRKKSLEKITKNGQKYLIECSNSQALAFHKKKENIIELIDFARETIKEKMGVEVPISKLMVKKAKRKLGSASKKYVLMINMERMKDEKVIRQTIFHEIGHFVDFKKMEESKEYCFERKKFIEKVRRKKLKNTDSYLRNDKEIMARLFEQFLLESYFEKKGTRYSYEESLKNHSQLYRENWYYKDEDIEKIKIVFEKE